MRWKHFLGFAVSGVFLWLAVRHVNLEEFLHAVASADSSLIVVAGGLTLMVCTLRAIRWRLLFSPTKVMPLSSLFSVIMIGFLANNVLPARLGELVMVFLMHQKERVGKTRTAATIALDRLFDVATLVVFLALALLLTPVPDWVHRMVLLGIALLAVAATLGFSLVLHGEFWGRLLGRLSSAIGSARTERIQVTLAMFTEGLGIVRDGRALLRALLVSMLIWLSLAAGVFILFLAFGLELGPSAAIVTLAIVNLGLVIPSSPGFIGTFQFFCVASLGLFGVGSSAALAFATVYHLTQWLPTTVAGFYYLGKENLKMAALSDLRAA